MKKDMKNPPRLRLFSQHRNNREGSVHNPGSSSSFIFDDRINPWLHSASCCRTSSLAINYPIAYFLRHLREICRMTRSVGKHYLLLDKPYQIVPFQGGKFPSVTNMLIISTKLSPLCLSYYRCQMSKILIPLFLVTLFADLQKNY